MTSVSADGLPRSVVNLHTQAQVSHHGIASAPELLQALKQPDTRQRRAIVARAVQEAEIPDMADLLVDQVLKGLELHGMLTKLSMEGAIRRPDLLEWSGRFA